MTEEYWFNNYSVLFNNIFELYPKKEFSKVRKINAIAKLAFIYAFIIILLKLDSKYLAVSVSLLILSYYLGITENLQENIKPSCTKPTYNNPFMNFILGDQINNPNKPPACPFETVRKEQIKMFRGNLQPDISDLYGKTITDRNFYTMPSTSIVNDQAGFINFVYGDFGRCKSEGKDCLKNRDNRFHRGRYYYQY